MQKLMDLKCWQQSQQQLIRHTQPKQLFHDVVSDVVIDAVNRDVLLPTISEESVAIDAKPNDGRNQVNDSIDTIRVTPKATHLESSPLTPGIDGHQIKTFEDLLDHKLRNDSKESVDDMASHQIKPKQPFLKKGEGLKRYGVHGNRLTNNSNEAINQMNAISPKRKTVGPKKRFNRNNRNSLLRANCLKNKSEINASNVKQTKDNEKPIKFNRKVIPLTTKQSPNKFKNEIVITRNISVDQLKNKEQSISNSLSTRNSYNFDSDSSNSDIDVLQTLLKRVEEKKKGIKQVFNQTIDSNNEKAVKLNKSCLKLDDSKKKVKWSANMIASDSDKYIERMNDEENELSEPKFSAYTLAMKQQINALENRLSQLQILNKPKSKCENETNSSAGNQNDVSQSINKVIKQIETLNQRLMNIESRAFNLVNPQNVKQSVRNINNISKKTGIERNKSSTQSTNVSVTDLNNDTTVEFPNGDKMKITNDNTMFYTYASNGATQTIYSDGLKIVNFSNGQIEKTHKNGIKSITYTNGLQRIINVDSSEELFLPDGTIIRIHSDGTECIQFKNGDREIRNDHYMRREYSNGNIKTLYSDGTEETRYINGRLRIKDKYGNLIVDTHIKHLNEHIS